MARKTSLSDRLAVRAFDVIEWVDDFRKKHGILWRALTGFATLGTPYFLATRSLLAKAIGPAPMAQRLLDAVRAEPVGAVLLTVGATVAGAALSFIFNLVIVPSIVYLPAALANRALGFKQAALDEDGSIRLMAKYAAIHRSTKSTSKVRVICISGRHLFTEETTIEGLPTPLHELATFGALDVVMPASDINNPTIRARHQTYDAGFKQARALETLPDFIKEIESGKVFLKRNTRNVLHEHQALCMWRVVLFDHVCIVQNYFPNASRSDSYRAPTFVFEKMGTRDHDTFYDIFTHMFDLLKSPKDSSAPPPPMSDQSDTSSARQTSN
jgi:hypothetical protein